MILEIDEEMRHNLEVIQLYYAYEDGEPSFMDILEVLLDDEMKRIARMEKLGQKPSLSELEKLAIEPYSVPKPSVIGPEVRD